MGTSELPTGSATMFESHSPQVLMATAPGVEVSKSPKITKLNTGKKAPTKRAVKK